MNKIGSVNTVRKIQEGLLIEAANTCQAKKIRAITQFANVNVEVVPHARLNTAKGVITCRDLLNCSEDEIKSELSSEGVIDVRRMTTFRNGIRQFTPSIILTFNRPSLPQKIKAGFHLLPVRVYVPPPLRCFRCQRFNHTSSKCENEEMCHCGSPLHEEQCTQKPICINCAGSHFASSKTCPSYQIEAAIQRIKATERLSYIDAKRKVENQHPQISRSYAHVTSIPANTMTSTSSVSDLAKLLVPEILRLLEDQLHKQTTKEPTLRSPGTTAQARLQNPIPTAVLSKTLSSSPTSKNRKFKATDTTLPKSSNTTEQKPTQLSTILTTRITNTNRDETSGMTSDKVSLSQLQEQASKLLYEIDPSSKTSSLASASGETSVATSRESSRTRERRISHSSDESPPSKKKSNQPSRLTSPDRHSQPLKRQTKDHGEEEMDTEVIYSPRRSKKK